MRRSNYKHVKLKEVCDRITVGHVGPMVEHYVPHGVPFLRSLNIQPFVLALDDVKFVSQAFHAKLNKSALKPGDVAVVRTGYPGTACVIPEGLPEANCADLVVITPSPELNPFYLAAVFNSAWGRASVAGNLVGVAQQHFNVSVAKEMEVPLPPRKVQDRIAGILSAYDELIANNQRRIAILEEMARALYREWFVRYNAPGVVMGEDGVPEGWEVKPLLELANVTYGFPFDSKQFNADGEGTPIIRIRDIPTGATETFTEQDAAEKYHVYDSEILVGMDGDFHMCMWSSGHAYQNQRVAKFTSRGAIGNYHLFLALEQPIQELNRSIVGTTVAHLGASHIKDIKVMWPTRDLAERFKAILEPMAQQQLTLKKQTANLRRTRDLLLPRLMSGRVELNTVEV